MPLFFFLSGITYNEEKYTNGRKFLASKIKGILIPYFIFCIIALLRNIVEQLYALRTMGKAFNAAVLAKKAVGIVVALRGSAWACAAWFLPCIFVVLILMYGTFKAVRLCKVEKRTCVTAAAIVFLAVGLLYAKSGLPYMPWSIDVALVAFFFTALGWLCKHAVAQSRRAIYYVAAMIVGGGVALINYRISGAAVDMYSNQYGNPVLFLLAAGAGIILIVGISKRLGKKASIISHMGRNSLFYYGMNVLVINLIEFAANAVFKMTWGTSSFVVFAQCTIVVVLTLLLSRLFLPLYSKIEKQIVLLFDKYFGAFLWEKSKN